MSLRMVWAKGILTTLIAFTGSASAALVGVKSDWTVYQWAGVGLGVLGATLMAARNFVDQSVSKIEPPPAPPARPGP